MKFFTFSWGNNYIAIRGLLRVLGHDLLTPAKITPLVIEDGVTHSPEFLCFSGKIVIGQILAQIKKGARHFIFMSSKGIEACRCADTGFFIETLLKKDYPDLCTYRVGGNNQRESFANLQRHFPDCGKIKHLYAYFIFFLKLENIHRIERGCLKLKATAKRPDRIDRIGQHFLNLTDTYQHPLSLMFICTCFYLRIFFLRQKKEKPVVRIGIIGGEHIISEFHPILSRIRQFAEQGVLFDWRSGFKAIAESSSMDHPLKGRKQIKRMQKTCGKYLHTETWGTELISCTHALDYSKEKFDGLLHVYSFGCLPQMSIKPAVLKISKDRSIPLLSLPIGEKYNDAAIDTRIEEFIDLLRQKKTKNSMNSAKSRRLFPEFCRMQAFRPRFLQIRKAGR